MRSLRHLALCTVFFLDVHVKASEAPKECFGSGERCAVAADAKRTLEAADLRLSMSAGSLLEQRNESTIQLVRGEFYVEVSKPVVFNTPYVRVWCEGDCKGLFHRETDSLVVKGLEGRWLAKRAGEQQTYSIPAGFQIGFGEVTPEGTAEMEFPQSLPWTPTVNEWAALYPGKMEDFKPTLVKFRTLWKEAVEAASSLHQRAANREIASNAKSLADERARRLAAEREDKSLRDLFHEKNP